MENDFNYNEKNPFSSNLLTPIIRMKSLNLYKKKYLKEKSAKNIFLDNKLLSKNNENVPIISNSSINIFYSNPKSNKENAQIIERNNNNDINNKNLLFLNKTNYYSAKEKNKKLLNDSYTKDSIKNISFQNLSKVKKLRYYPLLKIKKDYLTDFNNKNNIDIEYKKRLKNINSSFSPDSQYSIDKKLFKDFSSNSIIYNPFIFTKNKLTKINQLQGKKIKIKYNKSFIRNKISFNGINFQNRKLYKFIVDTNSYGKDDELKKLSEKLKEKEKKFEKILEMENNKLFTDVYSIVDRIRFKKKYQNPFIYDKRAFKENIKDEYNNIINSEVLKDHLQLLKEMKAQLRGENENKRKKIIYNGFKEINIEKLNNKKVLLEKFKNLIIRIYLFFKQRNITIDIFKNYRSIKQSFTYKLTKSLIDSIKLKNYNLCCEIIEKNKNLVFDYDYFYLTPLHWAVKKNFYEFIIKLLNCGSIVDSLNFSGDSPLHIAVKNNFYDSACILLYYCASPFLKDINGKKPIELSNNFDMKNLLEKTMKIHYISYFQRTINKQKFIKNRLWIFFNEEFKDKISEFTFDYFKEKELFQS